MLPRISDQLCRAVTNNLNVGVMVLDAQYRIVIWNAFMVKHSEMPEAEVLGRDLFEAFPYLSRSLLELKFKSLRMLRNYSFTSWKQRPYLLKFRPSRPVTSGTDYMAQDCTFVPIFDGDEFFICVTLQDMTEMAQTERMLEESQDMNQVLQNLSTLDCLTGVLNRFHIERELGREFERATRYGTRFSLAMVDLDHFKQINDAHGHLVGDEVLRSVSRLLSEQIRSADTVGRYGGEEFLVLLAETDEVGGRGVAERLRHELAHLVVRTEAGERVPLTASFGVATFKPELKEYREMIYRADIALYRAKEQRNRVVLYSDEAEPAGAVAPVA